MLEMNCTVPASDKSGNKVLISRNDGLEEKTASVSVGNMTALVNLADLYFGVRSVYEGTTGAQDHRIRQQHDGGFSGGYKGNRPWVDRGHRDDNDRGRDDDRGFQDNGRKGRY